MKATIRFTRPEVTSGVTSAPHNAERPNEFPILIKFAKENLV